LQGQLPEAERRLRALSLRAQTMGGQLLGGIAQVQLTVLLRLTGRERDAQQQLNMSIQAAAGGGLLPFNELLAHQPDWLREQLQAGPECPLRAALLAELPTLEQEVPSIGNGAAVEALSARELAVLQLIAQGCSNQEISERLFISLHTVKTHARHINSKLGVERRTQAVARAKGLGLLR